MIISHEYPPNIEQIKKHFAIRQGTIYTYGDTIYAPGVPSLTPDLIAHEEVHSQQQQDPEKWWEAYIESQEFRASQELAAYKVQYQVFCTTHKDRNVRAKFLHQIASDLASAMYANCMSYSEAKSAISPTK